jgi:hypothetical protein
MFNLLFWYRHDFYYFIMYIKSYREMNKKRLVGLGALGIAAISMFASCTGKQGNQGTPGPSYTGAISGHIMLYDQYGTKLSTGLAGIQVTRNNPSTTVTTDANGYYLFTGVTTGDYTILVHDPNTTPYTFGDNEAVDFQYLADTLTRDVKLSAMAAFAPATLTAYLTATTQNDSLVFTITPDTRVRDIVVFVNSTSAVSSQVGSYLLSYVKAVPANATTFNLLVPANDLHDQGINTGSTAYFAAYGYPVSDYSAYENIATGTTIYNALSTGVVTASVTTP